MKIQLLTILHLKSKFLSAHRFQEDACHYDLIYEKAAKPSSIIEW